MYNCTDLGSSSCVLKFRSLKTTCDSVSYCVVDSISKIKKCNEATFARCAQEIISKTKCSADSVNYVYETFVPNPIIVALLITFIVAASIFVGGLGIALCIINCPTSMSMSGINK